MTHEMLPIAIEDIYQQGGKTITIIIDEAHDFFLS